MGKLIDWRVAGMVLAIGGAFSTQACDDKDNPVSDIAEACGLECDAKGLVEGNASISGLPQVDAFFGAVVNFQSKAGLVTGNINAELAKIKASLELDADATPAEVKAAIVAKFHLDADVNGGIKIAYKPATCAVSAKATVEATAKCDVDVDPGKVSVECQGTCEADASVSATCDASATVKCVGTAPELKCEGTCSGSCELTAAAACSGTCTGKCNGTCAVKNADGSCNGSCDGTCEGSCEVSAGATCDGKCKGSCEYTAPEGGCTGGASVKCEAKGSASVMCNGKCEGEVVPPEASAECEASAKAEASVSVECTPPSLDLSYQFDASLDAEAQATAQAEFEAFLVNFKASFSVIVAQTAQAGAVLKAGEGIVVAADGAVKTAIKAIDIKAGLRAQVGVGCAIAALPDVATVVTDSSKSLSASSKASAALTAAFVK